MPSPAVPRRRGTAGPQNANRLHDALNQAIWYRVGVRGDMIAGWPSDIAGISTSTATRLSRACWSTATVSTGSGRSNTRASGRQATPHGHLRRWLFLAPTSRMPP